MKTQKMSPKAIRRRRGRSLRKRGYYYAINSTVTVSLGQAHFHVKVDKVIPTRKPRRAKDRVGNRWGSATLNTDWRYDFEGVSS